MQKMEGQFGNEEFMAAANGEPMESEGVGLTPEKVKAIEDEFTSAFNEEDPILQENQDADEFEARGEEEDGLLKEAATKDEAEAEAASQKRAFKKAFDEALAAGQDVFEWNGKKYSTKMSGGMDPVAASQADPESKVM